MIKAEALLGMGILLLGSYGWAAAAYGLDQRDPVAPFWQNRLPHALPDRSELTVVDAFPGLTFPDPIGVVPEPNSRRLFVYTRQGLVLAVQNGSAEAAVVLDLHSQTQGWDDSGLLGLAFHPEYGVAGSTNRGFVYIYYQFACCPIGNREQRPIDLNAGLVSTNRLSRFTVPDGSSVIDPSSEVVLINQRDRNVWHNGGAMFFHPEDGFLYLSLGDEGGADSIFGNDQRIDRALFSGVIRIDVDEKPARSHPIRRQPVDGQTAHYAIPNDNPFLDPGGSILEEFWCIGLREPHRMTYDPGTRAIWEGDVGQGSREEVNLLERGGNYQWAYREGTLTGPKLKPTELIGIEHAPLHEYGHERERNQLAQNNCVIGGYVYRGQALATCIAGQYIFGDNGSGRIWALEVVRRSSDPSNVPESLRLQDVERVSLRQIAQMPPGSNYSGLSGFGLDHEGELMMCQMGANGRIYRLVPTPALQPDDLPPSRLSETGLFTNLKTLEPAPGLIPYGVNAPLWSDGAEKLRWMALPNDGPPYSSIEKIVYDPEKEWVFPNGTVFVKHFQIPTDVSEPGQIRRLETRLLVRDDQGGVYGVTYRWREDKSDADLLLDGMSEQVEVRTAAGVQPRTWSYPSSGDCLACHTPAAGHVLGVRTHQLNGLFQYPTTGRTDHQLRVWNHLELFEPALDEATLTSLPRLVSVNDSAATLQERIRSYLAANCAQCHRPGGVRASLDARFQTPLALQGLIGGAVEDSLGLEHAAVVVPGATTDSVLLQRLNRVGEKQMPPLARNRIDELAVLTFTDWIQSLPPATAAIGLQADYFTDIDLGDRRLTRTDPTVSFNWGEKSPAPGTIPVDGFSVRWSGMVAPRFSEVYTFETRSDDGVRLWIDGRLLIDRWTDHAPELDRGTIALEAGRLYPLKLEYYDQSGGALIFLFWQSAHQSREIVPAAVLSSSLPALPAFLPPYLFKPQAGGALTDLRLNAEQLGTYEVQRSTNLRDWTPVHRFEQTRGILTLESSSDSGDTRWFYRVLATPSP